jgi:hypothetical protein
MSISTSGSEQNVVDAQDALESDGSHLRETLNRRSKTLSYMRPIYELEANKNRYLELGLDRYDIFRLISAILDTIITSMGGFLRGASYEQLMDAVQGQIRQTDSTCDTKTIDKVTSLLLDGLTNEKARDSFRLQVQLEGPNGKLEWAPLVFKLVELRDFEGAGEGRYVATAQAINIYLSSLSIEIEGQQAADEAAVQHFIRHGKLQEAELAARTAMMRTVEYAERLRRMVQMIERGVMDIDWVSEVLPKMDEALKHVGERLEAEEKISQEAEKKMEEADANGRRRLVAIVDQLNGARRQHQILFNLLLHANTRFIEEHASRRFRSAGISEFPRPQNDVLKPLLRLSLGEIDELLGKQWYVLHPPRIRPMADFSLIAKLLLQPRRDYGDVGIVPGLPELDDLGDAEPPFTQEMYDAVQRAIDGMPETFRLSQCLEVIKARDPDYGRLALLQISQWYEEHEGEPEVSACKDSFQFGPYYGTDLEVCKK